MTNFEAIESLLKTGEKENISMAEAMLEGMPEVKKQLLDKWQHLAELHAFSCDVFHFFAISSGFYLTSNFAGKEHAPALRLLAELPRLVSVDISDSDMRGCLPENLYKLGRLADLNLATSCIDCLPESWGGFERIDWLNISDNQIKTLPESMKNVKIELLSARHTLIQNHVEFFAKWQNINKMCYTKNGREIVLER